MRETLYRAVRSAITALQARLKPAAGERKARDAREAATLMNVPFAQREAFNRQMNEQLDDSTQVLDDLGAKLATLRSHVVNLRNQLAASQQATEATWDVVKYGFSKEQGELQDGIRYARPWTSAKPAA